MIVIYYYYSLIYIYIIFFNIKLHIYNRKKCNINNKKKIIYILKIYKIFSSLYHIQTKLIFIRKFWKRNILKKIVEHIWDKLLDYSLSLQNIYNLIFNFST